MIVTVGDAGALLRVARLRVLASIDIDAPALRAELDRIAERTARHTGLPTSVITLTLDAATLIAGSTPLDGWVTESGGVPIEWSMCATVVETGRPYLVPDARTDAWHRTNPLVVVGGLRSYAGVPVRVDGQVVGAHCIAGTAAHTFTGRQLDELSAGAAEISGILHRYRRPGP